MGGKRTGGKGLAGIWRGLIGSATIHPLVFYTGKSAGYATWILMGLSLASVLHLRCYRSVAVDCVGYVLLALGVVISAMSMFNLGRSTTLGLPAEARAFKTAGLYRVSRNPMYLGFNLITLASVVYHVNVWVGVAGLYSVGVYHLIVLGEEKYLEAQYGDRYRDYKKSVRRYL